MGVLRERYRLLLRPNGSGFRCVLSMKRSHFIVDVAYGSVRCIPCRQTLCRAHYSTRSGLPHSKRT